MIEHSLKIVFDRESDGRWIAEVPKLPGVLAYGLTRAEARRKVSAIALRTLADRFENGSMQSFVNKLFNYV